MTNKQSSSRRLLITSALPYANGPLHLGHLVEYIQTDIWVRFQKLVGNRCTYVCADDAHGTAISLHAEKQGISPEAAIDLIHKERLRDFDAFHVLFDHYHSTHSQENRELSEQIYRALLAAGNIKKQTISQLYDVEKSIFLADRYIKGQCPKCAATDQYGDNCEQCGATYTPSDLINPRSVLSGSTPVKKDSEHFFFELFSYENMLKLWAHSGSVAPEIANKLDEWLNAGLHSWDISRDAPYFGFEIPEEPGKYFYVWLDAPIGYMASFKYLCDRTPSLDFYEYWKSDSSCEIHHFIGKDIINFHCLFWPAMLEGAGFRKPTHVHVHGYLTINGEKMSKSRGTFITAESYAKHLSPEYLRYYYAAKLSPKVDDLDFNDKDFMQRVNSDLVGKIANIASRCSGFIHKRFNDRLGRLHSQAEELMLEFQIEKEKISAFYENCDFNKAMRAIMALADKANAWIDQMKPWIVAKEPGRDEELQNICSTGILLFRVLALYLKPVLPKMVEKSEQFLNISPMQWIDVTEILPQGHEINCFKPLMMRITQDQIDLVMGADAARIDNADIKIKKAVIDKAKQEEGHKPVIDFKTFSQIDLRVAYIVKVEAIEESNKLLRLTIDLGKMGRRTIISGLKKAYSPEALEGKMTVVVANLAPRKMKFGISEGMLLSAGQGDDQLWILEPQSGAEPGMPVT